MIGTCAGRVKRHSRLKDINAGRHERELCDRCFVRRRESKKQIFMESVAQRTGLIERRGTACLAMYTASLARRGVVPVSDTWQHLNGSDFHAARDQRHLSQHAGN
jgi:hypothetical protein